MGGGVSIKKIYLYMFFTTCWGYKIMVPFKLVKVCTVFVLIRCPGGAL